MLELKAAKLRRWRTRRRQLREAAIASYGGKCVRCGFTDHRALQFDHVAGGGSKEASTTNRRTYYRHLVEQRESGKYQLLCANCNWIKRSERSEHTPILAP